MPIQTLSDVLAQRGAQADESQLRQIQGASGLAGLMEMMQKRKREEELRAQGLEFSKQFQGTDQGSQALQLLARSNPEMVAKLLAEQKLTQQANEAEGNRLQSMFPKTTQGQQQLQPVAPIQGQPLGNVINPQDELASITDPAQRNALMSMMQAEKNGVPATASVAPKQFPPGTPRLTYEQAQAYAGSSNKAYADIGKRAMDFYNKQELRQESDSRSEQLRRDLAGQASADRAALQDERLAAAAEARKEKLANAGKEISRVDALSIDRSQKASEQSNPALQLLDQADALYSKYESNRAEPILGGLSRVGAAFGMDKTRAADYEVAQKIAKDLGVIKLGLIGGSDTERELQVAIDTSPSPDKTVEANKNIIATQRKAINILQQEPDFKTEWIVKNGSLTKLDKDTNETYGKAWRKFQKDNFKDSAQPDKKAAPTAPMQDKKTEYNDYLSAVKQAGADKELRAKIDARARERGVIK